MQTLTNAKLNIATPIIATGKKCKLTGARLRHAKPRHAKLINAKSRHARAKTCTTYRCKVER